MTKEQLEAIDRRLEKATPGKWRCALSTGHLEVDGVGFVPVRMVDKQFGNTRVYIAGAFSIQDAEFIAHAPEDIEALVAEVKKLRGLLVQVVDFVITKGPTVHDVYCEEDDSLYALMERIREALG